MMDYLKLHYAQRMDWFKNRFDFQQHILEIGPSHNPIAPRREGYNTSIIDAYTTEELKAKYQALQIDTEYLESVDYVWRGEALTELLPRERRFDVIVASHVIEHLPNPLGFIHDCHELLNDTGRLLLAIPDQRRCFDLLRMPSSTGQILEAHYEKHSVHSLASVYDFHAAFCTANGLPSWFDDTFEPTKLELNNKPQIAFEILQQAHHQPNQYFDVHGWTFSPASFLLVLKELDAIKMLPLTLSEFAVSDAHEFYATVQKNSNKINLLENYDRMDLYRKTRQELCQALNK